MFGKDKCLSYGESTKRSKERRDQLLASVLTSFQSYRGIREERVVCIHIFGHFALLFLG